MAFLSLGFLLLVSAGCCSGAKWDWEWRSKALASMPEEMILHAPFTPFRNDTTRSLNVDVIPALAAQAKKFGVTTVWIGGSMGQFVSMNVQEREELLEAWVREGHLQGLYVIQHVGTNVLADAIELARHAKAVGADAIASVPPFYNNPSSFDQLFAFFQPIVDAAVDLPFFYYHIPGTTQYNIQVASLLEAALTSLPALVGVKYVSPDTGDWFQSVQTFNSTHALMFAPEPKLQGYGLGFGRGCVLAEDFFAPTYIRMKRAFLLGQWAASYAEQAWKNQAGNIFGQFGGQSGERTVYKVFCDVDMGPPRWPSEPIDDASYVQLIAQLTAVGFFNATTGAQGPSFRSLSLAEN